MKAKQKMRKANKRKMKNKRAVALKPMGRITLVWKHLGYVWNVSCSFHRSSLFPLSSLLFCKSACWLCVLNKLNKCDLWFAIWWRGHLVQHTRWMDGMTGTCTERVPVIPSTQSVCQPTQQTNQANSRRGSLSFSQLVSKRQRHQANLLS